MLSRVRLGSSALCGFTDPSGSHSTQSPRRVKGDPPEGRLGLVEGRRRAYADDTDSPAGTLATDDAFA